MSKAQLLLSMWYRIYFPLMGLVIGLVKFGISVILDPGNDNKSELFEDQEIDDVSGESDLDRKIRMGETHWDWQGRDPDHPDYWSDKRES